MTLSFRDGFDVYPSTQTASFSLRSSNFIPVLYLDHSYLLLHVIRYFELVYVHAYALGTVYNK